MKVKKIYFDMDDTLADFSLGIEEICGIRHTDQDKATTEQDNAMWQAIKKEKGFYRRLKEVPAGVALFHKLRNNYNCVEILTAIPREEREIETAEEDKKIWVKEHLDKGDTCNGVVVHAVRPAEKKLEFAKGKEYILIDDRKQNIEDWNKTGGTGFWFNKENPAETLKELENASVIGGLQNG